MFVPDNCFQKCQNSFLDCLLYEPELFIALIAEDLAEEGHFMVVFGVLFDACDYGCGPLDYQVLQPVSLVQVRVHVLLHRFLRQLAFIALRIKLRLLGVDIVYQVLQLFQGQCALQRGD